MKVNKENMIGMLNEMIGRESANMSKNAEMNNAPLDDVNDMDIYLMGYVRALQNLLFMVSVNGE